MRLISAVRVSSCKATRMRKYSILEREKALLIELSYVLSRVAAMSHHQSENFEIWLKIDCLSKFGDCTSRSKINF